MTEERVCPPIGSGSVDLAAFHEADAKGQDLVEALAAATTRVAPLAEHPPIEGDKSDLLELAATEGVDVKPSQTKPEIAEAIAKGRAPSRSEAAADPVAGAGEPG